MIEVLLCIIAVITILDWYEHSDLVRQYQIWFRKWRQAQKRKRKNARRAKSN